MTTFDSVLDGLEHALELERELGVRGFACDRGLLTVPDREPPTVPHVAPPTAPQAVPPTVPMPPHVAPQAVPPTAPKRADASRACFVFVHDRPLDARGLEMLAKTRTALNLSETQAPLCVGDELPAARIFIVLGSQALRKHFPGVHAEPGQWIRGAHGEEAMVTYSPAYILRFTTVTPTVTSYKRQMWSNIKSVMTRLRAEGNL